MAEKNTEEKTKIKKVTPYPIVADVTLGSAALKGRILKLTHVGFLIDMDKAVIRVGQTIDISFTLPVHNTFVACKCVAVKTYDRVRESGETYHISELHFKDIASSIVEKIMGFLVAIKQGSN